MTREARQLRCPENVLGWIPWYADGDLTDRQKGAVQAHASECADCRAELEMIGGAPFEIDVELPDPDQAFLEISARIAAETEEASDSPERADRSRTQSNDQNQIESWDRIAEWVRDDSESQESESLHRGVVSSGVWRQSPALATAAALILVCVSALGGALIAQYFGPEFSGDVYQSATTDSSAEISLSGPGAAGIMIDVVFRDSATASDIATMLRDIGGEITSGPSKLGVYRLRLSSPSPGGVEARGTSDSDIDIDLVLSRLRSTDEGVAVFAEVVR